MLREANPERLSAFSDAVFAVLITVLVLDLRPPGLPNFKALLLIWPTWLSYAVSYLFIAIVWASHHHLMRYATKATPRLMWFNFALLFSVSLLPLSTAWMAVSELASQPVSFYAAVFFLVNATYILLIWELVDRSPVDDARLKVRRIMRVRSIVTLCLFGAATVLALKYPLVALGICVCCLVVYLKPDARIVWIGLVTVLILPRNVLAQEKESAMAQHISYRTVKVDGLSIFYREAGPKDAPTILLLHGLPSSSRMFEPLLTRLAGQFHMVAPDYPGFGHSDAPTPKEFSYTFDNIAKLMDHFTEALNLTQYTLYMQDYGGPVGFRMALAHPNRVEALIVQDAVAHNEGLGANWKTRREFWADRASHEAVLRTNLLSLDTTRTRHVGNDPNLEKYDPDLWTDEYAFLNKPGEADIQSDLFYDYRTNVDAYPKWQAWMQKTQPRLLVLWGKYDLSFELTEPEAYHRDVPKAQVHVLDAGHFALDTAADEIADLVRRFKSNKQ